MTSEQMLEVFEKLKKQKIKERWTTMESADFIAEEIEELSYRKGKKFVTVSTMYGRSKLVAKWYFFELGLVEVKEIVKYLRMENGKKKKLVQKGN